MAGVCKGNWRYLGGKRGDTGREVHEGKRWGEGGEEWGHGGTWRCLRGAWGQIVRGSGQDVLGNEGWWGGGKEDLGCSDGL